MGKTPSAASWNNLTPDDLPEGLTSLNELEEQLVAQRIPFLKMVRLPAGGQRGIYGGIINVPAEVGETAKKLVERSNATLPHDLDSAMLVPVVIKKKIAYKSSGKLKYIDMNKVLHMLRWLKANNPYYDGVVISDNWKDKMQADKRNEGLLYETAPTEENEESEEDENLQPLEDLAAFNADGAEIAMPSIDVICDLNNVR